MDDLKSNIMAIIAIMFINMSLSLLTMEYFDNTEEIKKANTKIALELGYYNGQKECLNKDIRVAKVNDIYQWTKSPWDNKELTTSQTKFDINKLKNTSNLILLEAGYFEGQIDCLNDIIKIEKNSDNIYIWKESPWSNGEKTVYDPGLLSKN